ncbi:MAG: hypothetical protein L6Q92_14990 [Phycisphaerae bacterium]|nr:hypothetical protein [Phycisphaerae bacterium]
MNFIRQRLITLRSRARALQAGLRRWSLYADTVSPEMRGDLIARMTPGERSQFDRTCEMTRERLRPVAVHVDTMRKWFDFILEKVNEQFDRARALLDQGRNHECLAILADIEQRMLLPNGDTVAFVNRCMQQRAGHDYYQKLLGLDAIIRDLYLPSMKIAHQRGLVSKEALGRSPIAYLVDGPDGIYLWRQHQQAAAVAGRHIPISLIAIPRRHIADPWNLVGLGYEVGVQIYNDLSLGFEFAHKLLRESSAANVSNETAPLWSRWHETLFGDIFGTLRLGSAYVSGMIEVTGSDPRAAIAWSPDSPTPPIYVRWHIMLQTLHLLGFADEARAHFGQIHMLCGDPAQLAQAYGPVWMQLINEARAIAGLMAFTPCQKLGGVRVIDVVPPFLSTEAQHAQKVKDILLAGDENCVRDESCRWADSARDVPAHLAVAGLRLAFDATEDYDASRRLWIRFWCLMQLLTEETIPSREREDREYAIPDATLKTFAHRAVPAMA